MQFPGSFRFEAVDCGIRVPKLSLALLLIFVAFNRTANWSGFLLSSFNHFLVHFIRLQLLLLTIQAAPTPNPYPFLSFNPPSYITADDRELHSNHFDSTPYTHGRLTVSLQINDVQGKKGGGEIVVKKHERMPKTQDSIGALRVTCHHVNQT